MAMLTVRRALCYNIATVVAVTVVAKREDIVMRFFDRAGELADLAQVSCLVDVGLVTSSRQ